MIKSKNGGTTLILKIENRLIERMIDDYNNSELSRKHKRTHPERSWGGFLNETNTSPLYILTETCGGEGAVTRCDR